MINKDLRAVIAANLGFFMNRKESLYKNPNALGVAAGISPNTIRYLLNPAKRPTTTRKVEGYPTLDKLQKIAQRLSCQVWELLHPDIQKSMREREMYRKLEQDFKSLPPVEAPATVE